MIVRAIGSLPSVLRFRNKSVTCVGKETAGGISSGIVNKNIPCDKRWIYILKAVNRNNISQNATSSDSLFCVCVCVCVCAWIHVHNDDQLTSKTRTQRRLCRLLMLWARSLLFGAYNPSTIRFSFCLYYTGTSNILCMKQASGAVPSITRPISAPFLSIRVLHVNRLF